MGLFKLFGKRINLLITDSDYNFLQRIALKRNTTMSDLIRDMIEKFRKETEP